MSEDYTIYKYETHEGNKTLVRIPSYSEHMIVQSDVDNIGNYPTLGSIGTLKKVTFLSPSNLKNIMLGTFLNCTHLKSVDFRNCTQLRTVGSYAFRNCISLETVYFPILF